MGNASKTAFPVHVAWLPAQNCVPWLGDQGWERIVNPGRMQLWEFYEGKMRYIDRKGVASMFLLSRPIMLGYSHTSGLYGDLATKPDGTLSSRNSIYCCALQACAVDLARHREVGAGGLLSHFTTLNLDCLLLQSFWETFGKTLQTLTWRTHNFEVQPTY